MLDIEFRARLRTPSLSPNGDCHIQHAGRREGSNGNTVPRQTRMSAQASHADVRMAFASISSAVRAIESQYMRRIVMFTIATITLGLMGLTALSLLRIS